MIAGLSACLGACGSKSHPVGEAWAQDAGEEPGEDPVEEPAEDGGVRFYDEPADGAGYIFDDSELRSYELELAPEDWEFLDSDPAEEIYVEGAMRFEGREIAPVGIRYKGSIGGFVGCVAGGTFREPDGAKTCDKLSMKVKVDWESDDDRFFGLKKLQFHAMTRDASMMRERLGYQVFREMGVPAPRAVHVKLTINGEYQGVFILVEQIDGRFTRSRFVDGEGTLYKEIWPIDNQGEPREAEVLEANLRSNRQDIAAGRATVERMQRFGTEVSQASPLDLLAVLDRWMDLDHTMRYVATDRGLLNDDGIYHWYCRDGSCAPHNFFWYEEEHSDRVYLVPWDLDDAMKLMNPVTTLNTDWDETTNGCEAYSSGFGERRDAACDPILRTFVWMQDSFHEHTEALLEGPFAQQTVEEDLDRWEAQIADAVAEASAQRPQAPTLSEMRSGVESLKVDLAEMRRRMRSRLE